MRQYKGVRLGISREHPDPHTQYELQRLWRSIGTLDQWATHASDAFGNITKGNAPIGSGAPLVPPFDPTPFWLLAGRITNTVAYGGTGPGGTAWIISTSDPTPGKVLFGHLGTTVYDEVNERVGIGIAAPLAALHVKGAGATALTFARPGSGGTGWTAVGAASIGAAVGEATADDDTSYALSNATGNDQCHLPVGGLAALPSTATWTLNIRVRSADANPHTALTVHDGTGLGDYNITTVTGSYATFSQSLSQARIDALRAAGAIDLVLTTAVGDGIYRVTQAFFQASLPGTAVQVVQNTTALGNLTEWQNSSAVAVASVNASGMGQFQNVALEDPGAGTNTITLQAPTTPTTHVLTLPPVPIAGTFLSVDGAGVTSWTATATAAPSTGVSKFRWAANGPYIVDTSVDGAYIAPNAFTVTKTILTRRVAGSGGTTTVILKQNGSTVDTRNVTAAAGANATDTSGALSLAVAAGDRLTVDTTAVETGTPLDYSYELAGA